MIRIHAWGYTGERHEATYRREVPTLPLRNLPRRLFACVASFALMFIAARDMISVMLPERTRPTVRTPMELRWRCTDARGMGAADLSAVTGDADKLRDERLLRMRGRRSALALVGMGSVTCDRSDGSTLLDDMDAGSAKSLGVGVVSSAVLNARGVEGSGVRGRETRPCISESGARSPELKNEE